jgi:hypothetical protein
MFRLVLRHLQGVQIIRFPNLTTEYVFETVETGEVKNIITFYTLNKGLLPTRLITLITTEGH